MAATAIKSNKVDYARANRERREYLESLIRDKYTEIGIYLEEIRDLKLFKPDYKSFDSYCQSVWGHTRRWGDRIINAVQIKGDIKQADLEDLILTESQARVLSGLNSDELEIMMLTLKTLKDKGETITARLIQKVRDCYENNCNKPVIRLTPYFRNQLIANDKRLDVIEEKVKQIEMEVAKILDTVSKLGYYFFNS